MLHVVCYCEECTLELVRKLYSLVDLFCCLLTCILCRKAIEDLDHILWRCEFVNSVRKLFFQTFGFSLAPYRDINELIWEFLPHLPFCDKGRFSRFVRVYSILWDLEVSGTTKCLEGWIGSLVRFAPLLLLIRHYFVWSEPFPLRRCPFVGLVFCMGLYFFIFFSMKVVTQLLIQWVNWALDTSNK